MTLYPPIDFSIDCGILLGIITMVLSAYYWISGNTGFTYYNMTISFIASSFQMATSIIWLEISAKGLIGPTSAILQSNSLFNMFFSAVFIGLVPNLLQLMFSLILLGGVFIMVVFKK